MSYFKVQTYYLIFTKFNTSQSLYCSLVKLTIRMWRTHNLVKQDGQHGCSVLGTDLYDSRPMCSMELFLEYKIIRQQKCFLFDGGSQSTNGRHVNACCTHKLKMCRLQTRRRYVNMTSHPVPSAYLVCSAVEFKGVAVYVTKTWRGRGGGSLAPHSLILTFDER